MTICDDVIGYLIGQNDWELELTPSPPQFHLCLALYSLFQWFCALCAGSADLIPKKKLNKAFPRHQPGAAEQDWFPVFLFCCTDNLIYFRLFFTMKTINYNFVRFRRLFAGMRFGVNL
jgi:hypothetical protein